jgi:WD repeat-containing protein mio
METAVRWSPKSETGNERFLFVEVVGKTFKLCRFKSRRKGIIKYETISEHRKVPAFRAFDWSPTHEGIVAVGQSSGEATVLRIDDGSQAVLSFPIRNQRLCNAIAFNNQGLLAAGLDKVRTDNCLNIWDLQQQLPSGNVSGFVTTSGRIHPEPLHKLASSEPITSIKFFRTEPQTLVAGVKGQFVRLYDLREAPESASVQFATRCVSNVAIDSMDENYFASCYPTNSATICVWDRRAGSRPPITQTGFFSASSGESTPLRTSLELKNAAAGPASIWSLRFSNTRRGCLGMLSSTGHFKTYDIGKEYLEKGPIPESNVEQEEHQDNSDPEDLYLHGIRDIQHPYYHEKEGKAEAERIVSFDFMSSGGTWNEPKVITLTANGGFAELAIPMVPEPETFSSIGLIHRGRKQVQQPSDLVNVVLGHDSDSLPVTKVKPAGTERPGAVQALMQYLRCEHGYLFSFKRNQAITSEDLQLRDFWLWLEWAHKDHLAGNAVQDNLDLAYLGVHAIWMDELGPKPHKPRSPSPSPTNMAKVTENLVQRLNIPVTKTCSTDYEFHRRFCLYILQQAWTYEQLETIVNELVSQNHHTKAAAMAVFANEAKLAYRALRSSSVQFDKMLAMAVSAVKRVKANDDEHDDEWAETIEALARDLSDPFAHAILAFVKEGDWNAVIEEESLPLSYRVGVAIRWLDDSTLTQYISRITREVVNAGNIQGIVLTGLGTQAAFELLSNYMRRSGDLQTTVLALSWTVPRYLDDAETRRKFLMWRETYREYMNSWNLHFNRVDFDIISSRIAMDADGKRLLEPTKPQVALTCGYCTQKIAHFPQEDEESGVVAGAHKTQRHPLTSEKAAAIGTVCPKCGRRLPRCGVCDMELGTPDPTYLKWAARGQKLGSVDLSASFAGSAITTLGPGTTKAKAGSDASDVNRSKSGSDPVEGNRSKSSSDPAETNLSRSALDVPEKAAGDLAQRKPLNEDLLRKFIAFCIKCKHGCHANHAMDWFRGVNGREGHSVCPVSECNCVCDV